MTLFKLGKCQKSGLEAARIWQENRQLDAAGFTPGSLYTCEWQDGDVPVVRLWLIGEGDIAAEVRRVSEKNGRPVLDLSGWEIHQFFAGHTHYTVHYEPGCLTIRGANV